MAAFEAQHGTAAERIAFGVVPRTDDDLLQSTVVYKLIPSARAVTAAPTVGRSKQMPDPADAAATSEPNRRFQYRLKAVLVLLTLLCILLAVLRSWPERAVLIGIVLVAAVERIYRHRIQATISEPKYKQLGSIFQYTLGGIAGAVVGAIIGVVFLIVVYNAFEYHPGWRTSITVGASSGFVIGLIYPRFAITLATLLPGP